MWWWHKAHEMRATSRLSRAIEREVGFDVLFVYPNWKAFCLSNWKFRSQLKNISMARIDTLAHDSHAIVRRQMCVCLCTRRIAKIIYIARGVNFSILFAGNWGQCFDEWHQSLANSFGSVACGHKAHSTYAHAHIDMSLCIHWNE